MMMRSQVSRLGTLNGMQLLIDLLGELAADPLDLGEVLDTRRHHAFQASEARQQVLAALRADSRDPFERRCRATLGAPRPVARDREAVRLVTYALDEVQPRVVGGEPQRAPADPDLLQPGLALGTLGDSHQSDVREPDLGERLACSGRLPLAAVDEDRVG